MYLGAIRYGFPPAPMLYFGIHASTCFVDHDMQLVPPEGSIVHARTSSGSVPTRRGDLQAAGLSLLDFPKLPLALIWQRMCQLSMHDRCALLATSKAALGIFGEITDHMGRLQLTFDDEIAFPGAHY